MCGIAGILSNHSPKSIDDKLVLLKDIKTMTDTLAHRGPDGEGHWVNNAASVAIGHRRLAVIDLSDAAAQPMQRSLFSSIEGDEKRYTITYNGEIYNYLELKDELQNNGYRFHSKSDTEVILAAFDCWEDECLQKMDGMFAFAIWDAKKQTLFAARDRLGEKPFYFYQDKVHFMFASEMKALWAVGVAKIPDEKMLLNYLALGYVQNANDKEQTFFESIFSLPAGHYLQFNLPLFDYQVHPYWKIDKEITIDISPDQAIEKFNKLFSQSVSRRMRSDVPVGTSLSGGLDSAAVVATIFQNQALNKNQKTFSAVFPGFEKDESKYIETVVNKFNLANFKITPSADSLINDFEKLCYHQEEPFQSSSIYAQYKVFELAKQQNIKVLLDGQGADETLAGYHKYIHWYLQQLVNRKKFAAAIKEKNIFQKNNVPFEWGWNNYIAAYLPAHAAIHLETKAYNKIIKQPDIDRNFINSLRGREWEGIQKPVITKLNDMLFFNTTMLGLEELLRFADRNSMAHGVEVRLPFLNHQLVEFVFSLPVNYKMQKGWTKWLLRKAMAKKLPNEIVWRKDKIGYEPPQKDWMSNTLMIENIQEAKRELVKKGILKSEVLNKKIIPMAAHAADNYDWRYLCAAQLYNRPQTA
jgi:asparagine synthase (glutamine-hydrolysing)